MSHPRRRILYCNCTYARVVKKETKEAVLGGLADSGLAFDAVPDLCELAARRDPTLERLAAGDSHLEIVACYPRAVRWLFHAAGSPLPESGVTIHNMRTEEPEATLAAVLGGTTESGDSSKPKNLSEDPPRQSPGDAEKIPQETTP